MFIALDASYSKNIRYTVGGLFNPQDSVPFQYFTDRSECESDYIPGEFYKRELQGILNVLNQLDLTQLHAIIVDGYVTMNHDKFGLGYHVFNSIEPKIPVIGVAKSFYHQSHPDHVVEVYRNKSKRPLYVSAIEMSLDEAALFIQHLKGQYRIPDVLKTVDGKTRK